MLNNQQKKIVPEIEITQLQQQQQQQQQHEQQKKEILEAGKLCLKVMKKELLILLSKNQK